MSIEELNLKLYKEKELRSMVMKNDGRESIKMKKNKQHKKYKDIKCSNKECRAVLNIDEMIKNNDYDILPDGSYAFYCPCCDNSEIKKL